MVCKDLMQQGAPYIQAAPSHRKSSSSDAPSLCLVKNLYPSIAARELSGFLTRLQDDAPRSFPHQVFVCELLVSISITDHGTIDKGCRAMQLRFLEGSPKAITAYSLRDLCGGVPVQGLLLDKCEGVKAGCAARAAQGISEGTFPEEDQGKKDKVLLRLERETESPELLHWEISRSAESSASTEQLGTRLMDRAAAWMGALTQLYTESNGATEEFDPFQEHFRGGMGVFHAQNRQMSNGSSINEFVLLAFTDTWELQLLHFWLFLGIYLAALMGNGLIITAIAFDRRLHTPMYFFLLNLSLLDLGSISTTLPKAMANSLWDTRAISYLGCAAQVFFFVFLIGGEYCLLTVMAYDRYVAICKPLHYGTLLGSRACVQMAAAAWGSGFLNSLLHTANTFSLPLCQGKVLDQFFCEVPEILNVSCSDSGYLREVGLIVVSACLVFGCFVFIVLSYVQIFRAVLRIPSEQGRHKAFSTCLPHMAVVSLFVSTLMFAYLKPRSISSPSLDLVVSVLYSVVPPAVNPLIYSMRNQELKDALWKLAQGTLFHRQ
ncbi:olfactory receptor 14A16-like [Mycteria americana]|uniref:olfactory receptor 14A16-like n=1 Tax=Mycteria americana TaxID=33587 RepID=UPI003F5891C7